MTDRPSMWSLVQQATWLHSVVCAQCHERNERGQKPVITLDMEGHAWCSRCGWTWEPHLPRPIAV